MQKTLIISLALVFSFGLSGCSDEKKIEVKKPIMVLKEEVLPGKTPISAAKNVRDLTNNSTKGLEDLLEMAK